jgi:hypothetical protein
MRHATPLALLVLIAIACGGGASPGATPKETFEAFRTAAADHDWESVWELTSPERRQKMESDIKGEEDEVASDLGISVDDVKSMSLKEIFVTAMEKLAKEEPEDLRSFTEGEYLREEISEDGNSAKAYWKSEGRERRLRLVKVDGKWYVDDMAGL